MELLQPGTTYTFTLNPESQPALYQTNKIQKWYCDIIKDMSKLKACIYELNLEISKLGRLHYHGWIRITTPWRFYLEDIPYLCTVGSFEIDTISDMDEWQRYMDKNKIEMLQMCNAHNIPLTINAQKIANIKTDKLNYDNKLQGIQKKITEMEYLENVSIDSSDTQTED